MRDDEIRILKQYVDALDEALLNLEKMYMEKNIEEVKKIKNFMYDIQNKIDELLKRE